MTDSGGCGPVRVQAAAAPRSPRLPSRRRPGPAAGLGAGRGGWDRVAAQESEAVAGGSGGPGGWSTRVQRGDTHAVHELHSYRWPS